MKHLNNYIVSALVGIALLATSGCASLKLNTTDIADLAEMAVYTGAAIDMIDNPGHRVFYQATYEALGAIVQSDDYSPSALVNALQNLPVKQFKGAKGSLLLGSTVVLVSKSATRLINDQVAVKEVVNGMRDGLRTALAQ